MSDIIDSMARYIDNIPDGAVHTCSDLCIKAPCLVVRGKQEIERLRKLVEIHKEDAEREIGQANDLAAKYDALQADNKRLRHEWQRECADTDGMLQLLGLCPSEYRSEGGSLLLMRVQHTLRKQRGTHEAAAALEAQQAEIERLRKLADVERLDVMWQQLVRERDDAARRADYWKAEHLAGNDEIERLRGLLREARMGVNNSAVQFGYPYTDLVDRITFALEGKK